MPTPVQQARNLLIAAITLLSGATTAFAFPNEEYYTSVTPTVVTEHSRWANPYYRGRLRVLWILPITQHETRLAVEIHQRLETEYTVCHVYGANHIGCPKEDSYWSFIDGIREDNVLRSLRHALSIKHVASVMGEIEWQTLPRDVREALLEQVELGTGLVFLDSKRALPPDTPRLGQPLAASDAPAAQRLPEVLTAGLPLRHLPLLSGSQSPVSISRLGQGRVAAIHLGGDRPVDARGTGPITREADPVLVNTEYSWALLARVIIWAAQREPEISIHGLEWHTRPRTPYGGSLRVKTISTLPHARQLSLQVMFRDLRNRRHRGPTTRVAVPPGQGEVQVLVNSMRPGRQYADVWLRDGAAAVCWASEPVEVKPEASVRIILAARPADRPYERSGTVRGTVRWNRVPTLPAPTGRGVRSARLTLSLCDNRSRILARTTRVVPAAAGVHRFSYPLHHVTTPVAWLSASLSSASGQLGSALQELLVPQRPPLDDFVLGCSGMWQGGSPYSERLEPLRRRELTKYGVTVGYMWADPAAAAQLARENQTMIPSLGWWWCPQRLKGTQPKVRTPCLSSPEFLSECVRMLRSAPGKGKTDVASPYRQYGVPFYPLAGEFTIAQSSFQAEPRDYCWSPSCLEAFRDYAREQYGSLKALNEEYGTQYQSWSEVVPQSLEDARKTGNFAPWVDHRLSMERVVTRFFSHLSRTIHQMDPLARVGFDSPVPHHWSALDEKTAFQSGYNYPDLIRSLDGLVIYDQKCERELIRSLARPGFYYSEWWGGYIHTRKDARLRYYPWRMLLSGAQSSWYYTDQGCEDALAPDLRPQPHFLLANKELQEIRSGIGKAILSARRELDPVAVLWSQPSYWARALQYPSSCLAPHNNLITLLDDLGLGFRYVEAERVRLGSLKRAGYRLLVLPWSQALSPVQAEAIRDFVRTGGTVLADVRPGIMDAHCKELPVGQLDDVFGLEPAPLRRAGATQQPTLEDGSILPLALYEDGLTARTAIAHGRAGGAGAIFVNRFGHGRAVLLNILTSGYAGDGYNAIEGLRQQGRERTIRRTVERLLGDAGIRAPITLTTAAGPLAACSIARFRAGSTRYLAILPDYCVDRGKGIPTTIQLPRRYHLYDMRRGTYLGHASKITTVAKTGIARLYALLPYRVSRIQVQGPARAERGVPLRLRFTCTASGATPGPHVFHVELTDPAGRRADWAFANLSAPKGDADFTILFAVNDPAGRWRLTVRDVATGMRSSRTILLPQAQAHRRTQ